MPEHRRGHLLLLGAGYTGLRLAREAVDSGWAVTGTTRTALTEAELRELGANSLYWDMADDGAGALDSWSADEARRVAIYTIPTIFKEYVAAEGDKPARHVAPVLEVLDALERNGVERFVYVSSTSVYGDHDGEWVDETAERAPTSPYGKMRKEIEDAVLSHSGTMSTFVCRSVGIYGPERTLDRYIESGRYKLVDGGKKPGNRIHVDDLAGICFAVATGTFETPRDFIATDGAPVPVRDLVEWLVENRGVERPEEITLEEYAETRGPNSVARWTNVSRFRSVHLDAIGYELRHPTALHGYRAIFADEG